MCLFASFPVYFARKGVGLARSFCAMGAGRGEASLSLPPGGDTSLLALESSCTCGEGSPKTLLRRRMCCRGARAHCWDPVLECWQHKECSGLLPPVMYRGTCASIAHHLYLYGGYDGSAWHGSLYQLDTKSLEWQQLSPAGPMKKSGCEMVAYGNKLVLFGGYGIQTGSIQPGAEFVREH